MEEALTGAAEGAEAAAATAGREAEDGAALDGRDARCASAALCSAVLCALWALLLDFAAAPFLCFSCLRPFEGEKSAERWEALKYSSYT